MRCPTCLIDAVQTQVDARRWLPVVRRELADLGVELTQRVRVRLVAPDELTAESVAPGSTLLGVTEQRAVGAARLDVVEIRIAAGLSPTHFGRAVAHEVGHAWLTQRGGPQLDPAVEEGLCELFAHAWLKRQRTALADELRRRLRENPDPVYGGGFRIVHAAVVRNGIAAVLTSLTEVGELP